MGKWHISKSGKPNRCYAKIQCRLSSEELHGSTKEEAILKYENALKLENTKNFDGLKKKSNKFNKVPKSLRPRPIDIVEDKDFDISLAEITVPHDPNAKYSVLSDVDGTLTKGSLVLDHAIYLHEAKVIDLGDLPEKWTKDPKNEEIIVELAEKYREEITGHNLDDLKIDEFLDEYEKIDGKFYSSMDKLRVFKERGWEVQLISGSPDFLVKPFAERNGFYGKGSDYFTDENGKINGKIEGMFGHEAKESYIQKLNIKRFKRVLAFGDTASDAPLFTNAHHSTLVQPTELTKSKVQATRIIEQ